MAIQRKRGDTLIRNVSGLPKEIIDKYRSDTHLSTVLYDYGVTTLYHLKKKLREFS